VAETAAFAFSPTAGRADTGAYSHPVRLSFLHSTNCGIYHLTWCILTPPARQGDTESCSGANSHRALSVDELDAVLTPVQQGIRSLLWRTPTGQLRLFRCLAHCFDLTKSLDVFSLLCMHSYLTL
jgi:hypothetical protein